MGESIYPHFSEEVGPMKSDQPWTVRVERQSHRDAVRRLRKAYSLLWRVLLLPSTTAASRGKVEKVKHSVQEVQK